MAEYFATCNVQGPISVHLMADSLDEVLRRIESKGRQWIDDSRCDVEDSWEDYPLEEVEYKCVYDSGIQGYWMVWKKEDDD